MTDMNLPGGSLMPELVRPLTRRQQHAAAIAVCARATDVDDARELLDMLGLRQELKP